jgi:hypothetical protein
MENATMPPHSLKTTPHDLSNENGEFFKTAAEVIHRPEKTDRVSTNS